jgi:hypothetical protein
MNMVKGAWSMRKLLIAASLAALTLTPAWAFAQAPIREGLRATGEAAAQGTQAVVEGTGQVIQGTAEATRNVAGATVDATGRVIGGAADATRRVVGGTARGLAAGVDALTPDLPLQARVGANLSEADRARDARWRFARHNGEWWYYGPENAWMYHRDGRWNRFEQDTFAANPAFQGEYAAGYRGPEAGAVVQGDTQYQNQGHYEGQYASSGQTYTILHDASGRAFICDNGQRVYVDEGQQGQQNLSADQQGYQPTPTPAIPTEAGADASASVQATTPAVPTAPASPRDINQSPPPATEGSPVQ